MTNLLQPSKIKILKAGLQDAALLTDLAKTTFIESHGQSAAKDDIDFYVAKNYTVPVFKKELADTANHYHIIYLDNEPAGFSKIVMDRSNEIVVEQPIAKLDRLYLLKKFCNKHLGAVLLQHNIQFAKAQHQKGVWLYVWTENISAVKFYKKSGFQVIGSYDFKISETHSNPNHQMMLKF